MLKNPGAHQHPHGDAALLRLRGELRVRALRRLVVDGVGVLAEARPEDAHLEFEEEERAAKRDIVCCN